MRIVVLGLLVLVSSVSVAQEYNLYLDASPLKQFKQIESVLGSIVQTTDGCTGTHIGENVIVSAGHCTDLIWDEKENTNLPCQGHDDPDLNLGVVFLQNDLSKVRLSKRAHRCKLVHKARWSNAHDYMSFSIQGKAHQKTDVYDGKLDEGVEIAILGFPGYLGEDSEQLVMTRCHIIDSQVAMKFIRYFDSDLHIASSCKTHSGMSGGPVIDWKSGKIAGVLMSSREINDSSYQRRYKSDFISIAYKLSAFRPHR